MFRYRLILSVSSFLSPTSWFIVSGRREEHGVPILFHDHRLRFPQLRHIIQYILVDKHLFKECPWFVYLLRPGQLGCILAAIYFRFDPEDPTLPTKRKSPHALVVKIYLSSLTSLDMARSSWRRRTTVSEDESIAPAGTTNTNAWLPWVSKHLPRQEKKVLRYGVQYKYMALCSWEEGDTESDLLFCSR